MPKLAWEALSEGQKRHLLRRFKERPSKEDQAEHDASLMRMAQWVRRNSDVPKGN